MSSSLNFLLLTIIFWVIHGLPELERVPSTCSRPGSRVTCDFSASRKGVTVCGVCKEEECVHFCRYLASQLNSTKPPRSYSTITFPIMKNLLATCHSGCNSVNKKILSEKNRSRKLNARAMIYLTVKPHGAVESKFKVFKKPGRLFATLLPSNLLKCRRQCSGCFKRGARCPRCCGRPLHGMPICTCGNCKKHGAYCPPCYEYPDYWFAGDCI